MLVKIKKQILMCFGPVAAFFIIIMRQMIYVMPQFVIIALICNTCPNL